MIVARSENMENKTQKFEKWYKESYLGGEMTKDEKTFLILFSPYSKEGKFYVKSTKKSLREAFDAGYATHKEEDCE